MYKQRHLIYDKEHCWQYEIKLNKLESDLSEIRVPLDKLKSLPISSFNFKYVDSCDIEECHKIKKFIETYEWLGNMPLRPTHRFAAYYQGRLVGAIVMSVPNSFSKILGEDTPNLEKLISRGACISWAPKNLPSSLIMWSIRWMVKNTQFRIFTAYSDPEAKELGTIYQACNFYYLGNKFGADKLYYDPQKPKSGWFSSRIFRKINKIKSIAKKYSIPWEDSWQSGYRVVWENMDDYTRDFLRAEIKKWVDRCEVRKVPPKHKYCYILGRTKKETAKLRKKFFELGNENHTYPKER